MEPFDYSTLSHFSHFYRTLCLLCSFCENFSTQPFVFSTWHTRVGSDGVLEKTFFAAQWKNTFSPTKLARLHCMPPVPNTAGLPLLFVLAHINSEPPHTLPRILPCSHPMVLVSEIQHPRSLDFKNQRRVVVLRDQKHWSWEDIAAEVVNLKGGHPSWKHCSEVWNNFSVTKGHVPYNYGKCGRN